MKRTLGVSIALSAGAAVLAAGLAFGGSWDERVFGSHVDFDAVAAAGPSALPALIERGRELFKAKFTTVDGAGRPKATQAIIPTKRKSGVNPPFSRTSGPDSNSCFGCHNDPVEGGSGDDVANVFVSEGFESAQFDNTDPSFSSERHTVALMGAGLVELLAREMTADLQAIRADAVKRACASGEDARADLVSKGVRFGWIVAHPDGMVDLDSVDGVDADLIVRPFSRKGVFTSLRQFTINALNVHHGMEAVERFGVRWPRAAFRTRSRRETFPPWLHSRRHCRRPPSRRTCRTTGARRRPRGSRRSTRSAAPRAMSGPCPSSRSSSPIPRLTTWRGH
jgi:hypothetical protein